MLLEKEIQQKKFRNSYHKLAVNLIYTANWLNAHLRQTIDAYDITPPQYNILRILRGQHPFPASVNLLKERMLDKMSDASRLVERLRKKGFIKRALNLHDRREVKVSITTKGLKILKELDPMQRKADKLLSVIPKREADKLNRLMDSLRGTSQ